MLQLNNQLFKLFYFLRFAFLLSFNFLSLCLLLARSLTVDFLFVIVGAVVVALVVVVVVDCTF